MKKILTLLFAANLLLACNSRNDKEKSAATEPAIENHSGHAEKATGLMLNNGTKWKADSTTLLNVALLQKIVSGAAKQNLESYMQTAAQLEGGLNKMVSECKMQGADHDALHQWLEPLMEKTKDLKKATTTENAATDLRDIEKQISLFAQYFDK